MPAIHKRRGRAAAALAGRHPAHHIGFAGETVWIGQHVQLVYDGARVAAVHAIARDITRQKQAEEGLRASEAKYRFFIERAFFALVHDAMAGA